MENEELIPTQQIGQQSDVEEQKAFSSRNKAEIAYRTSSGHLLKVNEWHKTSNFISMRFQLVGRNGEKLDRLAAEKDFIRINFKVKDAQRRGYHAWVCIEHLEEFTDIYRDIDCTLMVTRPSNVPGSDEKKIAHFLSNRATCTFLVFRQSNVLNVEIHGRNEAPNTEGLSLIDLAKNLVVNPGSEAELYLKHWHLLIKGILC